VLRERLGRRSFPALPFRVRHWQRFFARLPGKESYWPLGLAARQVHSRSTCLPLLGVKKGAPMAKSLVPASKLKKKTTTGAVFPSAYVVHLLADANSPGFDVLGALPGADLAGALESLPLRQ